MLRAVLLLLFVLHGAAALSQDRADPAAIRGVIEGQIAAFGADDFDAALTFATPAMQASIGSPEAFQRMVMTGYAPVYRPQSIVFGELRETAERVYQQVFVGGPDGLGYTAVYLLEAQPDGSWRIAGCIIAETGRGA